MTQTARVLKTAVNEAEVPSILEQVLEAMERRDAAQAYKPRPIEISNFDELRQWAEMAARSGMVPKDYVGKPDAIMIAVDMGAELGLKRMQSLQGIAVINGRPSVWGDAMWALIISQPSLENAREWTEGEGDSKTAFCEIKRRGRSAVVQSFSVAQAKKAGLFVKQGPWSTNPDRMLQLRARAFASRDTYADALKGLAMAEEVMDYADDAPAPRQEAPRAPIKMPEPEKTASAGPSEKTRQTVEGMINKLVSCEDPQEWIDYDTKSAAYRAKLIQAHPELAREVEAAFAEARDRLFPHTEATLDAMSGDGDIPSDELPDFDMERAVAIASLMETAATRKELDGIKNQGDNAKWLKSVEARLDIKTLLVKSYEDAAARLGAA